MKTAAPETRYALSGDISIALRSTTRCAAMGNVRRASLITSLGLVLVLQAFSAFASGREGEQYVPVVQFIVYTTVSALVVTTAAGGFVGAIRAKRRDESVVKGSALGVLKGIGAFVVLAVITTAVLTVLGGIYIVYALVTAP